MKKSLLEAVEKLRHKEYVNTEFIKKFLNRIEQDEIYTRDEGNDSHFCSFFLPFNLETKKIFLGDHKKAGSWVPPGGHIDKGENPIQTVQREFREELRYELTNEKIELFDLSIKNIFRHNKVPCNIHFDLWHIVYVDLIDFDYDKREFYDAKWVSFDEAKELMTHEDYNIIIQNLRKRI